MAISFNLVPNGILTSGVFVEFDTSKAQQGPSIQEYVALVVGQRLSTGTKPAGQFDQITSADQARQFYGAGSMLAVMMEKFISENKINTVFAYALDDNGSGVKAAGQIDIDVASLEAGTLSVVLAGRRYQAGVVASDTATDIALALQQAIQADADRQVDAAVNGGDDTILDITYRHAGEVGNEIDMRTDDDIELPSGLTATFTQLTGGTGNPSVTQLIADMGETQYHAIAFPYTSTTELNAMETEMVDRWGPLRQNDGQLITAKRDSVSNLTTFAQGRNNEQETVIDVLGPNGPHEYAANLTAIVAREGQNDPARPMQSVAMRFIQAPRDTELRTRGERNQLLGEGMSTVFAVAGSVNIERLRTTRKLNDFGAPDSSLADLNPKLTLSYVRYDFRVQIINKYSRSKLADDGTRFGPGQDVVTPKVIKAEIISMFRGWEELGLVEGIDQFKRDLIVQRNSQDPNRLDVEMPPDLINQLRVTAGKISFLL